MFGSFHFLRCRVSIKEMFGSFADAGSLWVAWHKHHHLHSNNFWAEEESTRDSWTRKVLLKLRPLAERFIKGVVGNGRKLSFWYDNWTPLGPLIKYIGASGPRDLCIPVTAKVANACDVQGWKISSPRSDQALDLHAHLTMVLFPSLSPSDDAYVWEADGVCYINGYSALRTWQVLRPRAQLQDWTLSIWFKRDVLKYAFTMWVSHLNRLPTRMRIASWRVICPTTCCLCSRYDETREYLFLACDYSVEIWRMVLTRLDHSHPIFTTWSELLSWDTMTSTRSPSILRKLVAQVWVFQIWKQRNNVLHNL